MGYALNNITAPDAYNQASTLYCQTARRLNLDLANAAVYYQLGHGQIGSAGGDPVWDSTEYFMTPSFRALDRVVDAIRIRAAIPLAKLPAGRPQAQITVHALTVQELGGG
jgi:hypothetical protein